ncbi:hypothetical protein ACLK19_15370 [Escherichia coli]
MRNCSTVFPIDEDISSSQLAFKMLLLLPDSEGSVREERRIVDEYAKSCRTKG